MSATTFAALIKEAIANMPDTLNSKKEIDEYYKKAIKDVKEKVKEENKGGKAPRKALGVKPAKAAPKKRPKKVDFDADGNEIEKVKKAPNAYQQFIKDNRTKVKEENPGLNNEEYFTLLASKWNKHKEDMKNKDKKEEEEDKEEDKEEEEEDKEEEKKADTVDTEITVDAEDKKKKDKEKKEKKGKKDNK